MTWLSLEAELAAEFGELGGYEMVKYQSRAFAEYARRKHVRNGAAKDRRDVDRLRRVHDRIPSLPRPVVCACGVAFAMRGGLIAHGRFCSQGAR